MSKVLISLDQPIKGFINVNPLLGKNIFDLSEIESASCYEIIADMMVDYIPLKNMVPVISGWASKLRHGGKICLGGIDSLELSRRYFIGELTTEEFNVAAFGGGSNPWDFKRGLSNINEITQVLLNLGLRITKKKLDGHIYWIEGERS